jgi:Uma2 family endonuclease
MSTGAQKRYSVNDYLALERQSEIKHEYFDGELFAMAGGTAAHSLISGNCIRELGNALRQKGCQVYTSDMRLMCPTGLRTYPDVSVVCDEPQLEDEHNDTLLNPLVIVEVLSDSSEAYDRGRKFSNYQTIPSLREYVLVAQDRVQVDHFARQSNDTWLLTTYTDMNAVVRFPVLECSIPLAEIYAGVKFTSK